MPENWLVAIRVVATVLAVVRIRPIENSPTASISAAITAIAARRCAEVRSRVIHKPASDPGRRIRNTTAGTPPNAATWTSPGMVIWL